MSRKFIARVSANGIFMQNDVTPAPNFIGINSSRSPDVVPAKAGNQYLKILDSPHQVRGRLCFRRNDGTNE